VEATKQSPTLTLPRVRRGPGLNVSSPAPSTTTWRTPRATAAAIASSANRLRAATKSRSTRFDGSVAVLSTAAHAFAPNMARANGSRKILPPSDFWCAARSAAAQIAVTLGCRSCISDLASSASRESTRSMPLRHHTSPRNMGSVAVRANIKACPPNPGFRLCARDVPGAGKRQRQPRPGATCLRIASMT
jgi:hypothetical protein